MFILICETLQNNCIDVVILDMMLLTSLVKFGPNPGSVDWSLVSEAVVAHIRTSLSGSCLPQFTDTLLCWSTVDLNYKAIYNLPNYLH